ncbi:NUDIX hydrolase [Fulvivirga lutimaris]|uniref:NUDIX hydrolase n=1 Tax=Fulvivirga lutimaris TaxID=1819566 RepID=UPI0012BBEA20|nr:NUDIX hydrolase [Fulvivirga lutimaris]MTI41752.1 NUDIX domain-containing protein [Fulvivirga lutimaris]
MHNKYNNEAKVFVAVDCIIFGFDPNAEELKILLIKRNFEPEKGNWSLMGGFMEPGETLKEAANRVLNTLTGLENIFLEQLKTFSIVDRDPAERTISVAYFALINVVDFKDELYRDFSATWFKISEKPKLIFDHNDMVTLAMERLRFKASVEPIGFELLPAKFTMRQLQMLYEEIFEEKYDKRNFSKKVNSFGLLKRLDEKDKSSSKKGSFLYEFDMEKYKKRSNGFQIRHQIMN